MEGERERLRELGRRLGRLHALLMNRERREYEGWHGSVEPRELLHLLLHDPQFAWLRPLSSVMAEVDALVDTDGSIEPDEARTVVREVYRLLKSGDRGAFQDKYRDALQDSADVVMAHADVSKVLASGPPDPRV